MEDFALRTLDALSVGLDVVRQRAGGSQTASSRLPGNQKCRWLEPGSILWMPVEIRGARANVGDVRGRKARCSDFTGLFLTFLVFLLGAQPLFAQQQGVWTTTGAMISPREFGVQVNLSNGKVLVAGGIDNSGNMLAFAETYTLSTGTWASTGAMANARDQFAAVALPNGKVLVSGGAGASGAVLGGAELYDPATGSWTAAGSLSVPRFAHTATLLANGKVLVAGVARPILAPPSRRARSSMTPRPTLGLRPAASFRRALAIRLLDWRTGRCWLSEGQTAPPWLLRVVQPGDRRLERRREYKCRALPEWDNAAQRRQGACDGRRFWSLPHRFRGDLRSQSECLDANWRLENAPLRAQRHSARRQNGRSRRRLWPVDQLRQGLHRLHTHQYGRDFQ